jgi:hypothetical protein
MEKKKRNDFIALSLSVAGFTLAILIPAVLEKISLDQALGLLFSAVLVTVTIWYAANTKRMAKEMREQRYDALRPVIDIEDVEKIDSNAGPVLKSINKRPATVEEKILSYPFECTFRNYGAGAAVDVYSPCNQSDQGNIVLRSIGNIQANERKDIRTNNENVQFIMARKIGKRWALVAYYKDIYGRCFESKRFVKIEDNLFRISSLQHRKLDKQKDRELINEIWPTSKSEVSR